MPEKWVRAEPRLPGRGAGSALLCRARLLELQTPWVVVTCASSCASCFRAMIVEIGSGNPEKLSHLPCKTRLAYKSQQRSY